MKHLILVTVVSCCIIANRDYLSLLEHVIEMEGHNGTEEKQIIFASKCPIYGIKSWVFELR